MKRFLIALAFLLIATPALATDVTLAWDPVIHPDLAGYTLYHRVGIGGAYNYQNPSWISPSEDTTTGKIANLPHGKSYCFVARAFSIHGEFSEDSNEVCTLLMPGNMRLGL